MKCETCKIDDTEFICRKCFVCNNRERAVRTLLADEEFCEKLAHIKYQDYEECYEWQPWELFDGRKDEIRMMKQALRNAAGIKEGKE